MVPQACLPWKQGLFFCKMSSYGATQTVVGGIETVAVVAVEDSVSDISNNKMLVCPGITCGVHMKGLDLLVESTCKIWIQMPSNL